MPVYEYRCNTCGEIFTVFRTITEDPLVEGPDCVQDNSKWEDEPPKRPCSLRKLLSINKIRENV